MSDVLRQRMEQARANFDLDGTDWASSCAGAMVDIMCGFVNGDLGAPGDLPVGPPDVLEDYARACDAASSSMSLNLMLPSSYAHMGALGGGGFWTHWMGRSNRQACPATMQIIGLGASGAGKSTSHRALKRWYGPGEDAGTDSTQEAVAAWAVEALKLADVALADAKDAVGMTLESDDAAQWATAKTVVRKIVHGVDNTVKRKVQHTFSDATAEALVSTAIANGGAAFIRAAEQDMLDNLVRYSAHGGGASLTLFTEGWDGSEYSRTRKGSGSEATSAFVLSMSLLTQSLTFSQSFSAPGGEQWLTKGLLGRALVSAEPESSLEEDVAAALKVRYQPSAEVPCDDLSARAARIGREGGKARAARLLEDRLYAELDKTAGADTGAYLKCALAAITAPGVMPEALDLPEMMKGDAAVGVGVKVGIGETSSRRLEDLHAWVMIVLDHLLKKTGAGRVLNPVMTRLTYHLVRLASIRTMVEAAASDSEFDGWIADGAELDELVLEDTASRVLPWLVHMHVSVLAGIIGGAARAEFTDVLAGSHGRPTDTGALVVEVLKKQGAQFPMSATAVAKLVERAHGRKWREVVLSWLKAEYELAQEGEEESPYFKMTRGRQEGSVSVIGFGGGTGVMAKPAYYGPSGSPGGAVLNYEA